MKFDNKQISQEVKSQILETLKGENKEEAIAMAIEQAVTAYNGDLVNEITAEAKEAEANKEFKERLNLRTLSAKENEFYNSLKNGSIKQAITAEQIDIIPTTIVDNTMNEIKEASPLLSLVNFAPADVKKWVVAEKTGSYSWGALTAKLGEELSVEFSSLNVELGKLNVVLVIPKAIRELSNEFVDKYFTAVLNEVFNDGMEYGFLQGTGVNQPIGIMKQIASMESDGAHSDKALTTVTGFTPKKLAAARKILAHKGLRSVQKLYLVCNPLDRVEYVDPALLKQIDGNGAFVQVSPLPIEVIETANCTAGKGVLTIDKKYTMAFSGLQVKEYDQTKALDDADVVVAKAYANGRATDDDTAVVFDVTALVALEG